MCAVTKERGHNLSRRLETTRLHATGSYGTRDLGPHGSEMAIASAIGTYAGTVQRKSDAVQVIRGRTSARACKGRAR
eukprot:3348525-Amphidinium_carterae.1